MSKHGDVITNSGGLHFQLGDNSLQSGVLLITGRKAIGHLHKPLLQLAEVALHAIRLV